MDEQSDRITFCPQCGYEYEHWVEICPDCGVALETKPRAQSTDAYMDPNYDPKWTVVTNVPNAIIGNFLKSLVENAGIPVLMMRSAGADIAQFSHNDFVPQNLLVPEDRFQEARQLIDAPPGDLYGPDIYDPFARPVYEDDEPVLNWPGGEQAYSPPADLPEGWRMLPTEADLHARQEVRRSHGEVLRGWYWSDDREPQSMPRNGQTESPWDEAYEDESEYYEIRSGFAPYGQGRGDYYSDRNRWIRIGYGILFFALSLPFIIQVLGQIASFFPKLP